MAKATDTKEEQRGRRNEVIGQVISDKMDKTISVLTYRLVKHSRYQKYIRRTTVFKAHDEKNEAKVGDRVRLTQSRPLSKTKRWNLSEVVDRAREEGAQS